MKKYVVLFLVLAVMMMFIPILSLNRDSDESKNVNATKKNIQLEEVNEDEIKVLQANSSNIESINTIEYLVGVLAAEMPAPYHDEALKAQAVASYTYVMRIKTAQKDNPISELNGADISNDSTKYQGYKNKQERQKLWGDKFDEYEKKVTSAVKAVYGKVIYYNDEPILAAFHNVSSGKTESAQNVWGENLAYLKAVISDSDKLSGEYQKTFEFSETEFKQKLSTLSGLDFSNNVKNWVGESKRYESGIVNEIELCGAIVSGKQVASALDLRSSMFEIKYEDEKFIVVNTGNGHFVGMSQYGANYMAQQGNSWDKILTHYYTGVTIK